MKRKKKQKKRRNEKKKKQELKIKMRKGVQKDGMKNGMN